MAVSVDTIIWTRGPWPAVAVSQGQSTDNRLGVKDPYFDHNLWFSEPDLLLHFIAVFGHDVAELHYHPGRNHSRWQAIVKFAGFFVGSAVLVATARKHAKRIAGLVKDEATFINKLRASLPDASLSALSMAPDAFKRSSDAHAAYSYLADSQRFSVEGYYDEEGTLQVKGKIKKSYLQKIKATTV